MFGHDDDQNETNLPVTLPDTPSVPAPLGNDPITGPSLVDDSAGDFVTTPVPGAADDITKDETASVPADKPTTPIRNTDELMNIKQQALQQLSPLMSHLDQTPEERFRTTMMMIQASDNDSLIKNAYDAALAIPDEKVRAQALLDVVNEINYFTQQDGTNTAA